MGKSYIRGKWNNLCCDLLEELRGSGIVASVAHDKKRLTVYCRNHRDIPDVPREYMGEIVEVSTQAEADKMLRAAREEGRL